MSDTPQQSLQEKNKQIVAIYSEEFWGKGNADVVDELCSDDFLSNYPMHGPRRGKEAVKQMLLEFKQAFPNVSFHPFGPIPMIAEGDYVVTRWIGGGKHNGVAFEDLPVGRLETPNSGREIHFSGTTIFTLRDGKIVEETGEEGALTALQQLGLIPPLNPASGAAQGSKVLINAVLLYCILHDNLKTWNLITCWSSSCFRRHKVQTSGHFYG